MERAKVRLMAGLLAFLVVLAPGARALVPYSPRAIWELMLNPPEDPLKILEQSPLAADESAAVALARADWRETEGEHQISLDVPGLRKEDVKIEVEENRVLRVSGERKAEEEAKGDRWHRVERTAGKFWRQFRMPADADMDKVSARLEDGVLRITVPKRKEQALRKEPKLITILDPAPASSSSSSSKKEL